MRRSDRCADEVMVHTNGVRVMRCSKRMGCMVCMAQEVGGRTPMSSVGNYWTVVGGRAGTSLDRRVCESGCSNLEMTGREVEGVQEG